MSKTIDDLRNRLFDAIDGVKAGTLTVAQAKEIGALSQVIVNSAKTEVDYLRVANGGESAFLSSAIGRSNLPPGLPNGAAGNGEPVTGLAGVTRHLLRG